MTGDFINIFRKHFYSKLILGLDNLTAWSSKTNIIWSSQTLSLPLSHFGLELDLWFLLNKNRSLKLRTAEIWNSNDRFFKSVSVYKVFFRSAHKQVHHMSSTQKDHSFSAPKIRQFNTKNPSVQQPLSLTPKNCQFKTKTL